MSDAKPRSRAKKPKVAAETPLPVAPTIAHSPAATSPLPGTDLFDYFSSNKGRLIYKWMHYFEIYERHFTQFRNREIKFLEIGVFHGGSLQMWKNYFGPKAQIVGVDINPFCKSYEEEGLYDESNGS